MSDMTLVELLRAAVELGASDLHLSVGSPPQVRVNGELRRLALPALSCEAVRLLCESTLAETERRVFAERGIGVGSASSR